MGRPRKKKYGNLKKPHEAWVGVAHSSWGDFEFDSDGVPLDQGSTRETWVDNDAVITKFDLERYKKEHGRLPEHGEFDILDLGHWFKRDNGEEGYEPPAR